MLKELLLKEEHGGDKSFLRVEHIDFA